MFLRVEQGYNRGAVCPLPTGTVLLGRGEEATLRFLADGRRLSLSKAAEQALLSWTWPGNVRELRNVLERVAILAPGPEVLVGDLPQRLRGGAEREQQPLELADVERRHIARVLRQTGGRKAEAAEILGIDRKTLYRKLRETDDS